MSRTSIPHISLSSSRKLWFVVLFLYFLAGFTSLAYEVLWSRMLSLQYGVSIFGVVLTVTSFMFGLGSGSLAGAKWARKTDNPLYIFAGLEIAIALYALLLPNMLQTINGWLESLAIQLSLTEWYLLQGVESLCLLIIPAAAMGVGFAMVLRLTDRIPLSLERIYGLNTLGGVLGALFPLWGMSVLGWNNSLNTVAILGLCVGLSALFIARQVKTPESKKIEPLQIPARGILLLYAGIGAGSIMLEIGWVRLYGMIMLRTEYVLGIILAVFLLGIAVGSLVANRLGAKISTLMPIVTGAGVLIGMWLLPTASAWVEQTHFKSFSSALWSQALMLSVFTLPVTLALGAWLPILASRFENANASGVWLYGANCLGGAIGAVAASLIFIPVIGSVGTVVAAGLIITALGLALDKSRLKWLLLVIMLGIAWPLHNMPPVSKLLPKAESASQNLSIYEDAISLTQVVRQQDGQRVLLSDLQRMDASSEPSAVAIQKDQARLALLLHPAPRSILFLGLGTGISMAGSLPFPNLERTAVELSQGAIEAAKTWFAPVNLGVMDKAKIYRDDARHFVGTTTNNYDVIVGDLFHPDLAGMGSLLSVQQFSRVKRRLNEQGVFVQWLALNQFDVETINVILRGFKQVFPEAQLFMDGMHLAMVGPKNHFIGAQAMLANVQRLNARERLDATGGEGVWTWLGRYWGPIVASAGPVQDEWRPFVEYQLPRARYNGSVNLSTMMLRLLQQHPSPEEATKILQISPENKSKFGRAYVATDLAARAWLSSIQGGTSKAGNLIWMAYQANPLDRWVANALADSMLESISQAGQHGLSKRDALHRILKICPSSVATLRALWHLEENAGNMQEAQHFHARLLEISPLDSEAAKVTGVKP